MVGSGLDIVSAQHPKSITILTDNLGGGTGRHLVDFLEHRDVTEWPTRIFCYGRDDGLRPPEGVGYYQRRFRGRLVRFPLPQIRALLDLARKIPRKSGLLHTYFFWPIVYGRILKLLGRVDVLVENREDTGFKYGRIHRSVLRLLSGQPDLVICVSRAVQEATVRKEALPPEKVVVVENGVSIPPEVPARSLDARERLGVEPENILIGMVANLNRRVKAVDQFLLAMPSIVERVPEARFVIVGDGGLRSELESLARELGVADLVVFTGQVSDVSPIYQAIDVSVLTSFSEGLSITLLESMAHGLPVVVTAVGGNVDVVVEGETGHLVPPKSPREFADAVVDLCRSPDTRRRMGRAARERCEREYDIRRVSDRYEARYEALLGAVASKLKLGADGS